MKKALSLLLLMALLCSVALAETDIPTRTRDITIEGTTETVNETLYTAHSGYTIWLMDGWTLQAATDETAADATITDETAATDGTAAADETTAADETAADETTTGETAQLTEESLNYAPDVYAPLDDPDTSLTVQPALGLTADDADSMLSEATYTEDPDAVIGEIETFAMENGTEVRSVEVTSEGMVYRYWFIPGDAYCLCVTAQCPEEAAEGHGARMAEMVASIAFAA